MALELLEECWSLSTPDTIQYNAAISACGRGIQWQLATALLETMCDKFIQTDGISYNAAVSACEKGTNWWLALLFLDESRTTRTSNNAAINSAISACEKGCQW
eukprot:gnl/MRDRNA2_/MRDRNA2_64868_c1_seq1.p1 gnl/MRDRNA2_/MRDRNA2_64868_c1~~gnl/MRDRNA2_/MRDRNA2_64868_c1_seq1.p1  ORF type:complete len:103 (-),score=13.90 gnl/MRDRNA2_/MRDRNA2_64868_c1_seq1:623-931(-)